MPKQRLHEPDALLEADIIETMLAGLKSYRPDLDYPESTSDMQGCVRALLSMFEIKRKPLATPLKFKCDDCGGSGNLYILQPYSIQICKKCHGCGWIEGAA